jgi:hypothetical protein
MFVTSKSVGKPEIEPGALGRSLKTLPPPFKMAPAVLWLRRIEKPRQRHAATIATSVAFDREFWHGFHQPG